MRHEWTTAVVDGYATDEVDFAARLQAAGEQVRAEVDSQIISPLANAADGAVLTIQGHADRIDSASSHAAALEREAVTSLHRAQSANRGILFLLGDYIIPPPTDWAEYPYVGLETMAHGATSLVDHDGTEAARLRNRRVSLSVCRFLPDE